MLQVTLYVTALAVSWLSSPHNMLLLYCFTVPSTEGLTATCVFNLAPKLELKA